MTLSAAAIGWREAFGLRLLQHRFGRARDIPIKFSQTLLISSSGNKKAHARRGLEITAVLPTSDFSASRFDDLFEIIFTRLDVAAKSQSDDGQLVNRRRRFCFITFGGRSADF